MSTYFAEINWVRGENETFIDNAVGVMAKDNEGKLSITKVTLRPNIIFSGEKQSTREALETLHHQSHEQCFIANSVKTVVITEF
jgi:organic hydroperoxide reductase OsmC/OhrA